MPGYFKSFGGYFRAELVFVFEVAFELSNSDNG